MNFPPPHNFKPFSAVRPTATGVDLSSRSLRPALLGDMGRFSTAAKNEHDQLIDKTRTWVAQTFFGTLLKQIRNSPFKSDLFSGGQGGQSFGSLYDQQLAEHMTRGAGSKLVNSIVRRIEANAAYRKHSAEDPGKRDGNPAGHRKDGKSPALRSHVATALRA